MGTLTQVNFMRMEYGLPGPKTFWATDDPDDVEIKRYVTRPNPGAALIKQIFDKLLQYELHQTPVKLMIEGRIIVLDDTFTAPAGEHLLAARTAADAMHSALDEIERVITPPRRKRGPRSKRKK